MDVLGGILFFCIPFFLFCLCSYCCRSKQRGIIFSTPVVVTSATHTAPGGYPNAVRTTTVYPTSTSGYQQTAYPQQAPYPVAGAPMTMPMPMQNAQMSPNPIGLNAQAMPPYPPNAAPYPPTAAPYPPTGPVAPYPPAANFSGNPPSYDSAVGVHQPSAGFEKQMPYNPGYTAQY